MIINSESLAWLKTQPDNCIDSIVTDPPYGLNFMNKKWDYDVPSVELWKEVLRVLKPGGHLVSFSSSRTYHRMAVNVEDAGFEIRDQLQWLYGSGFPKSHNIGKSYDKKMGNDREVTGKTIHARKGVAVAEERTTVGAGAFGEPREGNITKGTSDYEGWGTALKPAQEPIVLARKPLSEKTIVDNVIKWGTGGINIDDCRVGNEKRTYDLTMTSGNFETTNGGKNVKSGEATVEGRFPANVIHDGSDEVLELFPSNNNVGHSPKGSVKGYGEFGGGESNYEGTGPKHNDTDKSTARFFYCAKVNKKERNIGVNDKYKQINIQWKNTEGEVQRVTLQADTEVSHAKVTEEYGVETKRDLEWNIELFGAKLMEKYQKECLSTTLTKTNSITTSQIFNWLTHSLTRDWIVDVISKEMNGGNPVPNVEKQSQWTITTNPKKDGSKESANLALQNGLLEISVEDGKSSHPTVKPVALMAYLCKLITPKGGTILDPFNGSGSSGMAAKQEGFDYIGIEMDPEYCKISEARIAAWSSDHK